jgi:hypothetical protein
MSQLTIQISDKADALIAQLQKEIFNRRRKKVSAEGVVETLLESGAKSQSDKRFATSWQNLVADIERAAMVAQTHGSKPSSLTDEEWALVISHRTRATPASETKLAGGTSASARTTRAAKATTTAPARRRGKTSLVKAAEAELEAITGATSTATKTRGTRSAAKAKPARAAKASTPTAKAKATPARRGATSSRARAAAAPEGAPAAKAKAAPKTSARKASASTARSSVARRMAKAASRLASTPITAITTSASTTPATPVNGGNGVEASVAAPPAL